MKVAMMKGKRRMEKGIHVSEAAKRGFQRAFNIEHQRNIHIREPFFDNYSTMSDWRSVGNDIKQAQEKYKLSQYSK